MESFISFFTQCTRQTWAVWSTPAEASTCMRARGSKAQPTWGWPTWRPWWASVPPRISATWGVAGDCGERSHFEDVFSISFKMFKTLPWKNTWEFRLGCQCNGCPCLFKQHIRANVIDQVEDLGHSCPEASPYISSFIIVTVFTSDLDVFMVDYWFVLNSPKHHVLHFQLAVYPLVN